MLRLAIIPVTPYQQNCSVLWCSKTRRAAVVDPGGDLPLIEQAIEAQELVVERILITHGHLDHAGGAAALAERLAVPIEGPHVGDRFWIDMLPEQGRMMGFAGRAFTPQRWLEDGDTVHVGEMHFEVLHCPGHTPGHVVFFQRQWRLAAVGDVLFAGSIGRTDLPGGDHQALLDAIRIKLWPLGDDVRFIPGHGPMSTLGEERQGNPFVGERAT
jgi:glyoxylase-like metal-dependent hydrolase (beta-lactamase superfamily II)